MVALRILSVALILSQVAASPALIQRLYGAPPEGEDLSSHHHHHTGSQSEAELVHSAGLQGSVTESNIKASSNVKGQPGGFSDQPSSVFNSAQIIEGRLGLPAIEPSESISSTDSDSSLFTSSSQNAERDVISDQTSGTENTLTTEQIANDLFHGNSGRGRSNLQSDGILFGQSNIAAQEIADGLNNANQDDLTITIEYTRDVYSTYTNVYYNSIPVTVTQFVKSTTVLPTVQITGTPVDDRVLVSTAPVTKTDTMTVTNTNTVHQFATEVSTDIYTITHRAYDIQQQVVTSTLVQTQVLRSTIVSTVILTEYDTITERQTVTNTVVVQPRPTATVSSVPGGIFQQRLQSINREGLAAPTKSFGISFNGYLLNDLEKNHGVLVNKQNQMIQRALKFPSENILLNTLIQNLNDLYQSRNMAASDRRVFQIDFYNKQTLMDEKLSFLETSSAQKVSPAVVQGLLHFDSDKSGHKHGAHGYY